MPSPSSSRSSAVLLALCFPLLAGARCKPKPNRVPPLCKFEQATEDELATKALPPEVWLRLISPTVNTETMQREGPLRDTCGLVVEGPSRSETFSCEGFSFETDPPANDRIELDDLVMSQVGEDKVLLWAATDEVGGGEALGVLSLALWTEQGIEIHATGALRGHRDAARMRMAYIGPFPVVILESDQCPPEATKPSQCKRLAHFVPIIDRRVRELPLYVGDRGCIGRAQLELSKKTQVELEGGWTRTFELVRSIEVQAGQIVLTDLVTLDDAKAGSPPTPFRKVTSERPLELDLDNQRLVLRDENLWDKMLRDHGSARVEHGGPEQEEPNPGTGPGS